MRRNIFAKAKYLTEHTTQISETHYSITYGYHAIGGLYFRIKEKVTLNFDLRYNLLLNPAMEEINVSGIISTVGIIIPLGSGKKQKGSDWFILTDWAE